MVTFADVESAAELLEGIANRTPVMQSRTINERLEAELFFKCENFQRSGAFKLRGAYNAMARLKQQEKERGVLTYSSGNHAQALSLAGHILGIPVTVIMPTDAPAIKVAATKGYGGEVVLYDPDETNRERLGAEIAAERGLTVIPPYDHPHIVAGQGTAAKELFDEVGALDTLLVPVGGGGLLSGSSISARAISPHCRVIGVEPEAGDDVYRSFRSGKIESVKNPDTIADGARTPSPSELTLSVILKNVDDVVTVPDSVLIKATRFYAERMKIIVEPTGCLSVGALLDGKVSVKGQRVGIIVSGGNVDLAMLAKFWAKDESPDRDRPGLK